MGSHIWYECLDNDNGNDNDNNNSDTSISICLCAFGAIWMPIFSSMYFWLRNKHSRAKKKHQFRTWNSFFFLNTSDTKRKQKQTFHTNWFQLFPLLIRFVCFCLSCFIFRWAFFSLWTLFRRLNDWMAGTVGQQLQSKLDDLPCNYKRLNCQWSDTQNWYSSLWFSLEKQACNRVKILQNTAISFPSNNHDNHDDDNNDNVTKLFHNTSKNCARICVCHSTMCNKVLSIRFVLIQHNLMQHQMACGFQINQTIPYSVCIYCKRAK